MATVATLFREYAASLSVDLSYQGFEAELAALPGAYVPPAGALLLAWSAEDVALGCVAVRPMGDVPVRPMGYVTVHPMGDVPVRPMGDEPGSCEMKRLHTRPDARGRGVGRALAVAAIEAARQAGYRAMRLDTLPDMLVAQALYRRLGFETTAPYYNTPVPGTIFMRKTLG